MGAGILPVAIHNGRLHFLFGKENKHADTPGWADFGGGNATDESNLQTAVRECSEELTGFIGSAHEIRALIRKKGTYKVESSDKRYTTFVLPIEYDEALPRYYNANQRFLQKHLDASTYEKNCIFEKSEIRWVTADEMLRMKSRFRNYYREIVEMLHKKQREIAAFI